MSIHSQIIGANVHQPKGADQASNGQVIKADGTGLTSWVNLFIGRLLTNLASLAVVTDNSGVATEETSIETTGTTTVDKNFHAIVSAMNANNAALESKINEITTLLQDLNITRGS